MGKRILPWLVSVPVGLAIVLAGMNAMVRMGMYILDAEITDRGMATVIGCQDEGVIHRITVGDLWRCELDVRWDSGRTQRVTPDSLLQFKPDDGQVTVVERAVTQGNRTGLRAPEVYRADFQPEPLWLIVLVSGGLLILGGLVVLAPLGWKE